MAAGKQKKRIINSTNSDQHRTGKKAKVQSSNYLISLKSQIGLKWDDYQKRVVPKQEQVGILWSDLAPFIDSGQKHCSGLADVTYVPPETFSLENLRSVLSYEVWATCLTEAERKFLIQFLPSETDAEENLHLLLTGQNHHFGNPSLSWSSSLCYGDIHPDAVLNKEKQIRVDEKAYRINLSNYNSNMVETVKKWKKIWLSCDDSEIMFRDCLAKHKQGDTRPKGTGGEMSMKVAQSSDVSKFMSYIEVSRTQHNLVKSMKQSGDGIKTKHLTRVIGDLNKFHVKPYGTLIDGEQRRLRQHWLNILHNDLPAAFEVHRDRKVMAENQRKLLSLELGEKNVSIVRKADQLAGITKELGQHGACENAGSSDLQNDLVEHSSQDMLHDGNDHCPSRQYCNEDGTKHMETSVDPHDSLCVKNQDLTVDNGTYIMDQSEKSDLQDQDHKDTSYVDKGVFLCASNLDEQNADLMDMKFSNYGPDVQAEDIKEISHTDTTIIDHSPEIQQKTTCYITAPIHAIDIRNTQAQNLEVITYTGSSIHAHEQDQGLKSTSYNGHCVNDTRLANSYTEMNDVIIDLKESQSSTVIPSNSSTLLSKSSGEQIPVEEFHLNDQLANGGKDVWELPGPHDSYYRPLENSMYNDSGGFQIRHRHLRGAQQGSVIGLKNGILSQQDSQVTIASAFPVDNPGSFMQQCSNRQSNGQLQIVGNNIGILPYSLEHIDRIGQPTALHSLVNNRLSQSTQFPSPLQEHQMTDQSNNALYDQLHKDPYSDVRFSAKGNTHIDERHSFAAHGPIERNRYNCFPQEHQPHDNWPAMESNNCLPQTLPGGSTNSDGSLFSALAPYNQPPSLQMQSGRSSPGQLLEMSNQAPLSGIFFPRIQDTAPRVPNIYGYAQNLPSSSSSRVASVGSVNNMQWTNLIQQNHPGMPNLMNRQFRGPWTR